MKEIRLLIYKRILQFDFIIKTLQTRGKVIIFVKVPE